MSHDRVARGDALVRPGQWHTTRTLDCSLTVLFSLEHEVSRRGAYHAYIGSGEHPVRLRLLGSDALAPGEAGAARVHLPVALPLLPGDRYVLRESGRGETVGGGEVLDVDPVLPASKAAPDRSAERVVAERGWVEVEVLERLTGERRAPTVGAKWIVSPDVLAATRQELVEAVAAGGRLGLDVAALDDRQRAVLGTMSEVKVSTGRALAAGAAPSAAGGEAPHPFVAALEASPFAPPDPDAAGVDRGELRDLVRRGLVVERDGCYFAPAAVDAAARTVARMLAAHPEGVTVAQVREELGTTRKYLLPLLGHLDATGVTRRRGDLRVAGARLPAL